MEHIERSAADHLQRIGSQSEALRELHQDLLDAEAKLRRRRNAGGLFSKHPSFFDSRGMVWLTLFVALLFAAVLIALIVAKVVKHNK